MQNLQPEAQGNRIICLCMCCKDYRNDAGQWEQLPQTLQGSGYRVSHGICPDCLKRVYGRESVIATAKPSLM